MGRQTGSGSREACWTSCYVSIHNGCNSPELWRVASETNSSPANTSVRGFHLVSLRALLCRSSNHQGQAFLDPAGHVQVRPHCLPSFTSSLSPQNTTFHILPHPPACIAVLVRLPDSSIPYEPHTYVVLLAEPQRTSPPATFIPEYVLPAPSSVGCGGMRWDARRCHGGPRTLRTQGWLRGLLAY